ncbi:AraC family transcriptional regulator [Paenibacillus flagellatus]|uniref:AraC family transcriptional regulator n=1 Tax=Paenibacillus flagellatus TaxID=2211139 RepID=A0A2V5KDG1_9BACL|nr:AraC family transcriptional regulator [Paenibacillus flagellatus]PYI56214.1 AraC family transcriptional regulator [Paenibacillus flagellatus]
MEETPYEYCEIWRNVPTPLEKTAGMRLVRAGHNVAKPNYSIGPKMIECYGMHFVVDGKVTLEYGAGQVVLPKNSAFCLWPNMSYRYRIAPSAKPLKMMWLSLDGPQLPELLRRIGLGPAKPYETAVFDRTARAFVGRIHRTLREPDGDPLHRQTLLYMLFERMSKLHADEGRDAGSDWLARSLDYFRLHFAEPLSIGEAARLAGVHRSHFTAMFHRETGLAPREYIRKLRMDKASSLLEQSSLSIGEIALTVGYADLYSFSRAFKNQFGRPPSAYKHRGL